MGPPAGPTPPRGSGESGGISWSSRSPLEDGGPLPHTRFPSPGYQCWQEEPLQCPLCKTGNPSRSLKGPAHRRTCSQALTLGFGSGTVTRGVSETFRGRLCGVASGEDWSAAPTSLSEGLLSGSQQGVPFPGVEPAHTQPGLNLIGRVRSAAPIC